MKNLKQTIAFIFVFTNSILLCSDSSVSSPSREEKLQKLLSRYEIEGKDIQTHPNAEFKKTVFNITNPLVESFNQEHDVTKKIEKMEIIVKILVFTNLANYLTRSREACDRRKIIAEMGGTAPMNSIKFKQEEMFKRYLDSKLIDLHLKSRENVPLSDDDIAELDTRRNWIKVEEDEAQQIHHRTVMNIFGGGIIIGAAIALYFKR